MKQKEIKELEQIKTISSPDLIVLKTKFFGIKKNWKLSKLSLGKMFKLSEKYIQLKYEKLEDIEPENQLASQIESVKNNAKICADIMAIAVDSWLPKWYLKKHFLKNVNSRELKNFAQIILKQSDYGNFMLSIVLMNGNRITKPKDAVED